MNRRHFVGQVVFGSAVAALARTPLSAQRSAGLNVKLVGMMGYVTRSDSSLLVALPGAQRMGHYQHIPFLMARNGSPIAKALGLQPMPGVVPGAFDMTLMDVQPDAFAFRCIDGDDLDIIAADGKTAVVNRATQLAHMQAIAPGKRLRSNLRRWAQTTVTVQGGTIDNSAAHPDAGKMWSFGKYRQPLTDATIYRCPSGVIRLNAGPRVLSFSATPNTPSDLWIVSAAGPKTEAPNPKRLEHGHLLFEFFADADPIVPTCEDAEGRITVPTEIPCAGAGFASLRGGYAATAPPHTEFCPGGEWCCDL